MDKILSQFTNEELLDSYGEKYRKLNSHSDGTKLMLMIEVRREILKRMENGNEKNK